VLIFSMHRPGKPDVRLICDDYSVAPQTRALLPGEYRAASRGFQKSKCSDPLRGRNVGETDAPSNRDTSTDLVPGAGPSSGDRVPSRRQSTAQLQRVCHGGPSPDHCIGDRRLMDLPGGTKVLAANRDAREPGGRRDRVSRDIHRGAALSASTSTTAPVRANDPFEWPRTYVNTNTARMKPCLRTRSGAGSNRISSSDWE
jgi:hypothetical protein